MYRFTSLKDSIKCNQSNVLRVLSLLFCCYFSALLPKVLVMKGNKLELWIDSLATWNLLTVQSNRWIINFNKDWAIFTNLSKADTWKGLEDVCLLKIHHLYRKITLSINKTYLQSICYLIWVTDLFINHYQALLPIHFFSWCRCGTIYVTLKLKKNDNKITKE